MEIITIEAKAYRELIEKIDQLHSYIKRDITEKKKLEGRYLVNDTLSEILGVSKRTAH